MRTTPMLKLTVATLAIVLAGTASAAGWRKLQIDASSETAFDQSVATFQEKLSPSRRVAFARSLQDIQDEGTKRATGEQRDYTRAEHLQRLHGLGYEEVVTLVDPTGKRAGQYRAAYYQSRTSPNNTTASPWPQSSGPPPSQFPGRYRGDLPPNTADSRAACSCMQPMQ